MNFSKIIDLVGAVAPTIATALGGPLAGTAVGFLATHLLGKDSATADELSAILAGATPDQLGLLKKAEYEFKAKMKELDIEVLRIGAEDRDSARQMQIGVKTQLVPALAIIIIASFVAVTIGTLMGYAKIESALAGTLIGYLSAKAEQVVAFYFGSSSSSQAKDLMLYNSTPTGK